MDKRSFVLVNPGARDGAVGQRWPELERELVSALGEGEARVVFTTPEDHGSGAVREALREGFRKIVVVGGDGTLSEALQGFFELTASGVEPRMIEPDAELAVMPAGRGDDFFKSMLGHRVYSSKGAWEQGIQILRHGLAQPTDIGRIVFRGPGVEAPARHFVNIASFGYPGLVVKRVQGHEGLLGKSWLGRSAWAYLAQSAAAMAVYRPVRAQVLVDGETAFDGKLFSGFVLNGRHNAGGVNWSKDCRIDDGLLDVVVFEPRSAKDTVMTAPRLLNGDWGGLPGVHISRGRRIEIITEAGDRTHPLFEIDGDLPEPAGTLGAEIEVLPGAIRLWRP